MTSGLTASERFVTELCNQSFLSLWTHPNPKGKKNKELCDCLVVCGQHVIIISVKEIEYRDTADSTGWERWVRAAIEKSADQIWGAERWLETVEVIERHDGREVTLPPKGSRRYHRVSVSLGAKGQVPLKWGELGNGFVHVCDEQSVSVLFSTLDTISDFVTFLQSVEDLVRSKVEVLLGGGGIEDFVALYLSWNYSFVLPAPDKVSPDMLVIDGNLWENFAESEDFGHMKKALAKSYAWDNLIDHFARHLLAGTLLDTHKKTSSDNDKALITMALQPRWYRLALAESFLELGDTQKNVRARVAKAHGGVAYVYLISTDENRELRAQELALRCVVARNNLLDFHTVVGIATDKPGTSTGSYSSDLVYLHFPIWTSEHAGNAQRVQDELGYFKNMQFT
jgi:hypothetical protein